MFEQSGLKHERIHAATPSVPIGLVWLRPSEYGGAAAGPLNRDADGF
jgi:hypothetical protein